MDREIFNTKITSVSLKIIFRYQDNDMKFMMIKKHKDNFLGLRVFRSKDRLFKQGFQHFQLRLIRVRLERDY